MLSSVFFKQKTGYEMRISDGSSDVCSSDLLWTMLAHQQGGLLNAATLARALAVDGKTVAAYLNLLVDLLLVRRLTPWHGNVRKRLIKSPKVYVRDCGMAHADRKSVV